MLQEGKLVWHILDCTNDPTKLVKEGLRAVHKHWRADIYLPHDGKLFVFFYNGDHYSRTHDCENVFDAMRWAQEQYDIYLELDEDDE